METLGINEITDQITVSLNMAPMTHAQTWKTTGMEHKVQLS